MAYALVKEIDVMEHSPYIHIHDIYASTLSRFILEVCHAFTIDTFISLSFIEMNGCVHVYTVAMVASMCFYLL